MCGYSQNVPWENSKSMEEGLVQELDKVLINISNSPKQEKDIPIMQETISGSC